MALPVQWSPNNQEEFRRSGDFWRSALGLAATGAIIDRVLYVGDTNPLQTGIHLVVCTHNDAKVLSALDEIIRPLRTEQWVQSSATVEIDQEIRRKLLEQIKADYILYRQSDLLPDPQYLADFTRQIAKLEQGVQRLKLLENPMPGRLLLAVQESAGGSLLVIYDDVTFCCLLEAAQTDRGRVDLELLIKSWHQQPLAKINWRSQALGIPRVWAIIVARPETTERLLLGHEPLLAGFASCCWLVDTTQASIYAVPSLDWPHVISKALKWHDSGAGVSARMEKEGAELFTRFDERVDSALLHEAGADFGFLAQLPRFVSKMSVILALAKSGSAGQITKDTVQAAVSVTELSSARRHALLQTWRAELAERIVRQRCEAVLARIVALGPISARELLRDFHGLRIERLAPILRDLIQSEQILKLRGGRFDIPDKWVSRLRVEVL